jgi:methylated-DNA-[protein]-cysteine S-methyltransferase
LTEVAVTYVAYEVEPWGVGELWVDGDRLLQHELPRQVPNRPHGTRRLPEVTVSRKTSRLGDDFVSFLQQRLAAYYSGEPVAFDDVPLDLDWCTPFQRRVADALRRIPWGETVTYGELAALAGHPNAQRAAGTFCARNRFGLVVPCHRVVAAGGLGPYPSLGTTYKRRLLEHEGVTL